jgi:hypothetical protein
LAILERPTYFEVAEVLPRVMKELGLAQITIGEAALRVAKKTAREIVRNGDDPLRHVRAFESLWIHSGYAKEIRALGTLDDEAWLAKSMGRSDAEVRDWVMSVLKDFAQ